LRPTTTIAFLDNFKFDFFSFLINRKDYGMKKLISVEKMLIEAILKIETKMISEFAVWREKMRNLSWKGKVQEYRQNAR